MGNIIGEIDKNQKEKIRVSIEEYRGSRFIDCRVYWQDETGEWKPSRKGISLSQDTIDEVTEALRKASKQLAG